MIRDDHRPRFRAWSRRGEMVQFPAQFTNRSIRTEKRLRRDSAYAQNQLRIDELNLPIQKGNARLNFFGPRIAIVRRPRFQNVRDEHLLASKPYRLQHRIQELTSSTDERLTLSIFIRAGRLPYHQPASLAITDTEDRLRTGLMQGAALTCFHRRGELVPPKLVHMRCGWRI